MAGRRLVTDVQIGADIMAGEYDKDLDLIAAAISHRKKMMFRPGSKVRMVGTKKAPSGMIGIVIKVNAKRISVGFGEKDEWGMWSDGEYLVPASMLEAVTEEVAA